MDTGNNCSLCHRQCTLRWIKETLVPGDVSRLTRTQVLYRWTSQSLTFKFFEEGTALLHFLDGFDHGTCVFQRSTLRANTWWDTFWELARYKVLLGNAGDLSPFTQVKNENIGRAKYPKACVFAFSQ